MENDLFTPVLEHFMSSPLVSWIKTFGALVKGKGTLLDEYVALVDGVFLNEVMFQINPKAENQKIYKKINNDASLRIQNVSVLVKQIKSYYQESLQQLVMMTLPNVLIIGKTPFSEKGTEEMKKMLLLLLGCAVQCERKEEFIDKIQDLDFDTKAAVAAHIQEVTHNPENVFDLQLLEPTDLPSEDLESLLKSTAFHLKRLVDERDDQSETITELTEERDSLHFTPLPPSAQSPSGSPGMRRTESRQHLSVELAEAKAKIRGLRQELEEKTEQFLDVKQEVAQLESELKRLQQENMKLLADARSARLYRDELDALREKAIRVDKLESEVSRYKERLHDIEFYKARVEELKEDNQVLLETKNMLEDQLEGARTRSDKLHELEKENIQMKARFHDLDMERDMDRKRIEELMEENMTLEMAQKQSMDESLHLGWELEQLSKTSDLPETPQKSLGHEVNELTSSRLLKLEMENQTLLTTVEELKSAMGSKEGASAKLLKMEKENQRLCKKLEKIEAELNHERQTIESSQHLSSDLMKEKSQLEKIIETLRENSERQIKGLEQENEHLNQTIASLRQRSQIGAEARMKDIEKENKILHESIKETSGKLNKLEFEKKHLKKELEHYKEKGERAEELEKELNRVEKENEHLQKKITSLNIVCEKTESLEQENFGLEIENRKLKKTLDSLKNLKYQMESLEKENSQLEEENLDLRRIVESLKSTNIKVTQLELENKELESEKEQLRKGMDLMKASCKKIEHLEVSYQGLDTENQRLQKALENSNKKIQQLENELQDLETENHMLQKNLEELKISSKRLEQLEKEHKLLEQETCQLEKDKKQLEKENKRLRQQAEIKDITLEEDTARISNLERENKLLSKETSAFKESCARLKELEIDNKELVKRATIDKKTLITLREDLVNEKLKTQQTNNELEKLTHELEKIGLNKDRLLHDEQTNDDDSRYKLLESKIESTLKKSLEIKEEKIASLEARLGESANFNQQLRQELKTVKKNYEALKQRQEEEKLVHSSPPRPGDDSVPVSKWERESQETTKELLKLKDRLIEIERNNATLQAEKQALKTQLKQLETQNDNLQAQIMALQKQTISLQEQNTTLQTQNAKLQVENSTLNSQSTSLMNQNSQLLLQQSSLETENESLVKEREELKSMYELLVKDHEKLAQVHERQAAEYESLISKHGNLKSAHKNLEVEHKDLEDSRYKLLESKIESTLKKSLEIKEEKIASLEARLGESANFNQQLRQELKTVKKNYEALKQRQEEEKLVHSSPPRPGDDSVPVSKWERESQETTKELLKLKDRLIEIERNNATLQAEKQALKTQLKQLETQNDNLQAQIMALQKQTISLQEQNTTLQTQNAKLQVENSTLNSQSTSLMNQNSQLLLQQSSLETENESLVKEREELKSMYELLVKDHEKLAQVHERQAAEYESLISKHGNLKSAHKNLEVEHKDLEDRYNQLLKQKVHLEDLEKALKEEQAKMLQENKEREMLSSDYQRLTEEHERLNHTYRQLLRENESLQSDHKNLKTSINSGKLEQTRLEAEFSKLKEKYQKSDITVTSLTNQCELLRQVKGNLEEENRHLMGQNQILALQNKTLLDQNMESKDFYQVEQRQYMDKINELRRQKEKLEEKIMDQYKFYEPSPPRRRGNWITLKMRKLIKSKKDVSREHLRSLTLPPSRSESGEGFLQLPQDSQDSSSVGSNSLEDGHPLGAKKSSTLKRLPFMRNRPKDKDKMKALYRRSVSMNDLVQSMVLAGGQWTGSAENLEGPDEIPTGKRRKDLGTMAFSTTAINFSTANQSGSFRTKQIIKSKDGASYEDISGQVVHDDSYMTTAGLAPRPASLDSGRTSYSNSNNNASLHEVTGPVTSQSRSQSHSSGDFNQHHDNEVWSNSSSPVQYYGYRLKKSAASSPMLRLKSCDGMESLSQSKKRLGSPGSEMVSLKQFLQESNKLTVSQIRSGSQEDLLDEVIRSLSSSSELAGLQSPSQLSPALSLGDRKATKPELIVQPSSSKAEENTRFPFPTVINAQSSGGDSATGQGTVCQQTKDAKQYATLPRASSVISTAEGTTRRTSIHDFLSKDNRSPVSVDPSPTKEDAPSLLNVEAAPEIRLSKSRSREPAIP